MHAEIRLATALCLLSGVGAGAGAAAAEPGFTLQQALSAPFPSDLTPAPTGGLVAWVYDEQGARNVWVADAAGHARRLTAYAGDDGADLGELAWDPGGKQVFYTRGGGLEGGGPVNARSLPSGAPAQMICAVGVNGGAAREVAPGHGAAVSPKGDILAFIAGGQIWTAPVGGGPATQRVRDRGQASALAFSPDGGRLAFVSTRTDHSLVGVLDLAADTLAWMSPSFDTDMAPEWSPDGKQVAWVRVPAGSGEDFIPHRDSPTPWSIRAADVATGAARQVWAASPGPGSVFHGTLGDRLLMWAAGDAIVFPWERTGWSHLYAVPAAGGAPRELTTGGDYEVFNTALDPDRARIVYSANQGDADRWHVWQVAVSGGAPRALSRGASIEDYPVFSSDFHVIALGSDARAPVRPVLVGDGLTELAPGAVPTEFPAAQLVEPRPVTFPAPDGLPIHGQVFLPPGEHARGPAVMFFHGGPYRQMLLGWHPMDAYSFMYGMNQYLAAEGYVVLSVNYRGGIGYGLDFREPPNFGADGASELNDIVAGANYLRSRSDVDAGRIGIWGGSYGGLMTALGLARAPDLLAAGVDYAGVHDWRALLPQLARPGAPEGAARRAYESSAIATLDRWRAPVLVAHSDDDRTVPFAQSVELIEALRPRRVAVEQLVLPDEVHNMLRARSWLMLFGAADDFLRRRLAPDDRR